jgi:hypothetical protein
MILTKFNPYCGKRNKTNNANFRFSCARTGNDNEDEPCGYFIYAMKKDNIWTVSQKYNKPRKHNPHIGAGLVNRVQNVVLGKDPSYSKYKTGTTAATFGDEVASLSDAILT